MATQQTSLTDPAARALRDSFEPAMVHIPEGWFLMGSETGQENERPVHRVWVDAFEMAAYQVTNAEYGRFLAATKRTEPPHWNDPLFNHRQHPVVAASWFDAVAYCDWLSEMTGRRYRLPTEAEWERAARGGVEGQLFPWGDEPPENFSDYARRWRTGPEPVGERTPNVYGLYDICENVHEWCADWYDAGYYHVSPERNPAGPEQPHADDRRGLHPPRRASRGGSWRHHVKVARCAARSSIPPGFQYADYGFRVARDISRG